MPCMTMEIDTSGWNKNDVFRVLDHLFNNNKAHVVAWIKDIAMDYICPDCEI